MLVSGVSGLLCPLERRRPRHPHPEGSQGGGCEAEVGAGARVTAHELILTHYIDLPDLRS
jgi:hypothetical protein